MSRITFPFLIGMLLVLAASLEGSFGAAVGDIPLVQVVDPADPLEDPEAVQDRVETGSPDETVLSTQLVIASLVVSVALIVLASLAWAAHSGRKNKPVSGNRRDPPSGG